jgi:hypothetical protein
MSTKPPPPPASPTVPEIPPAAVVKITELALGLVAHVLAEAARRLVENGERGTS